MNQYELFLTNNILILINKIVINFLEQLRFLNINILSRNFLIRH